MKKLLAIVAISLFYVSSAAALDIRALSTALSEDSGRPQADKARDAGRKPAQVLDFLGIEEGMTVVDLVAAAGYYTEVLSHAVGSSGKVYMQNSAASLTGQRGERTAAAINERLANNRLANVERIMRDPDNLGLPDNSLDAAVIALEFHELYLSDNPDAVADFLAEMRRVLKPGGVLGIIEHSGYPVYDPAPLHRALEAQVVADVQAAGMFVSASSPLLENPDDMRNNMVFDASIRGATDRFVLRVIKTK
ncbi:MAG: methyltransferase domain-containing protein [Gammaproteobacteria bacterium]|nr:methyltransferase domain-containing protein [Gammaproteobacteria bacterium]